MDTENRQIKKTYVVIVDGPNFPEGGQVQGEYERSIPQHVYDELEKDLEKGEIGCYQIAKVVRSCHLEKTVKAVHGFYKD